MESIYEPKFFSASDHINIKEYLNTFKRALDKFHVFDFKSERKDEFSDAFEMMQIDFSEEEKEFLSKSCSIKNLETPDDIQPINMNDMSFAQLLIQFKPSEGSRDLKSIQMKQNHQPSLSINFDLPPKAGNLIDLKPGQDVVITLSVMKPVKYQYAQLTQKGKMKLFKEVTLLGSNTIADFRDMIDCSSDNIICKEVSENPNFELDYPSSKDTYPSGFIFIDGVFYNDFRKENSIDYSEIIRNWAVKKDIGNFTTCNMTDKKFIDLSPRIGYPYVYQHKACCEHIVIFSQIRLLNSDDSLSSESYPYYSKIARTRNRYCVMCGVTSACWIVVDSDRLPQNNAPMCTTCFKSYNYVGGEKIGDFKAYPFTNLLDIS